MLLADFLVIVQVMGVSVRFAFYAIELGECFWYRGGCHTRLSQL